MGQVKDKIENEEKNALEQTIHDRVIIYNIFNISRSTFVEGNRNRPRENSLGLSLLNHI